jgi:hypothetical protein
MVGRVLLEQRQVQTRRDLKAHKGCGDQFARTPTNTFKGNRLDYLLFNEIAWQSAQVLWDDCYRGLEIAFKHVRRQYGGIRHTVAGGERSSKTSRARASV